MDDDQQAVTFVTKGQLIDDLQRLGVRAGDTLMLHVSVRAIGWIVGGPRVVLEARRTAGTLAGRMPTLRPPHLTR